MIFVAVGMTEYPFDRLLCKMDMIAPSLKDEVIMQIGASNRKFANCETFDYADDEKMSSYYDKADLIVCHSGVGTIMNGLKRNIPLVVVPRKTEFNEVDTDHQMMIARKIVAMGRGVCVDEIDQLTSKIEEVKGLSFDPYVTDTGLCDFVKNVLSGKER